jgi:hypothetical protein
MNKLAINTLFSHIAVVDEALDEVVDCLGLLESLEQYEASDAAAAHATFQKILEISRSAAQQILAAQHMLAMMREEVSRASG